MAQAISATTHHVPIVTFLNGIVRRVVEAAAWFNVALIFLIIITVILRYGFHRNQLWLDWPLVPMEELMWHFYSVPVMFGLAYAITNDSHIRIDLLRTIMSTRLRHIFEILGILLLLLPCLVILLDFSFDYAVYAFTHHESSQSTMGLPHRWIVKSVIPLTMLLMIIASIARLIEDSVLLLHYGKEPHETGKRVSPLDLLTVRLFKPLSKDVLGSDFLEFRTTVDGVCAYNAAQRATDADRELLTSCFEAMEKAHGTEAPTEEADIDANFHLAIAKAAHNQVLLHIMRSLFKLLRKDVFFNRMRLYSHHGSQDLLLNQHREIYEAIIAGDPKRARSAAEKHLGYVKEMAATMGPQETIPGANLLDPMARRLFRPTLKDYINTNGKGIG
jgi:DNA-binding FadR family transcriptional regulator/TRAP-type mannitol/chloroaromatic compound transport system permease small subunit